jgi:hypothetical protein
VHPPTLRQTVALFIVLFALVTAFGVALWHRQDLLVQEIRRADHGDVSAPSYNFEFGQLNAEMRAVMDKLGVTTTTLPSGEAPPAQQAPRGSVAP